MTADLGVSFDIPETVLKIENLKVCMRRNRSNVVALNGISLSIHRGRTLGLVGESGSGKSMTALSVVRLLPQSATESMMGRIEFGDQELIGLDERKIRRLRSNRIGIIFQEPATCLNPLMKVGKQVWEVIFAHRKISKKSAWEAVYRLFEEVGMPEPHERVHAYPHELSGGQQQRVMISMALACDPELLIADEPTTSLDVTIQAQILKLLARLQAQRRMAMLFISHDLAVIAAVAHEVAIIQCGRIVEQGLVEQIFSEPKHPYTRALIACRPELGARQRRLPTLDDFLESHKVRTPFTVAGRSVGNGSATPKREEENRPALIIENLHVFYRLDRMGLKQVHAVKGVSVNLSKGCTLGLVGESGSGKSTIGLTIIGLIQPTQGRILLFGRDLANLNGHDNRLWKRRCQMIFQDPYGAMNPRLRVETILGEPLELNGQGNRKEQYDCMVSLLHEVGLGSELLRCYPHQLSGGQRQRVCIARALALDPRLLICDEVVSALDVSVQAQILNLLKDIQESRQLSILFISHDFSVVEFMADEIAVMKDGMIVENGAADDILKHPQQAYTRQLIESINLSEQSPI
jgi:peptide/nickel transport system ATP-binding protein